MIGLRGRRSRRPVSLGYTVTMNATVVNTSGVVNVKPVRDIEDYGNSRDALFRHLTKEQQVSYVKNNHFELQQSARYRIGNASVRVSVKQDAWWPLCVHLSDRDYVYQDLPGPLWALAMKLYIEANEIGFLKTAGGGLPVLHHMGVR